MPKRVVVDSALVKLPWGQPDIHDAPYNLYKIISIENFNWFGVHHLNPGILPCCCCCIIVGCIHTCCCGGARGGRGEEFILPDVRLRSILI
jgi:hypothetical protein